MFKAKIEILSTLFEICGCLSEFCRKICSVCRNTATFCLAYFFNSRHHLLYTETLSVIGVEKKCQFKNNWVQNVQMPPFLRNRHQNSPTTTITFTKLCSIPTLASQLDKWPLLIEWRLIKTPTQH